MKAFVAGATGYTGREVVRLLCERGVETFAHVRPDSSKLAEWKERFAAMGATVDTTAWEAAAMKSRLAELQPDRVFALLGTTAARKKTEGNPEAATYQAVDYGLTSMLLAAAAAQPKPPGFVYLSSLGVSKGTRSAYLRARYMLEEELRASGLSFLIARPAMVSGDDRDESRPGERVATVVGDALLGSLRLVGAKKLHDRFASLNATQLAAGLVSAGCEDFASREIDASELRERAAR